MLSSVADLTLQWAKGKAQGAGGMLRCRVAAGLLHLASGSADASQSCTSAASPWQDPPAKIWSILHCCGWKSKGRGLSVVLSIAVQ